MTTHSPLGSLFPNFPEGAILSGLQEPLANSQGLNTALGLTFRLIAAVEPAIFVADAIEMFGTDQTHAPLTETLLEDTDVPGSGTVPAIHAAEMIRSILTYYEGQRSDLARASGTNRLFDHDAVVEIQVENTQTSEARTYTTSPGDWYHDLLEETMCGICDVLHNYITTSFFGLDVLETDQDCEDPFGDDSGE